MRAPERCAGLVVITPGYDPETHDDPGRLARWDALADGLERGGVEGFLEAYGDPGVEEGWRETVLRVIAQRMARHEHPEAVADALRWVPRSRPFGTIDELGVLDLPVTVVASGDEADRVTRRRSRRRTPPRSPARVCSETSRDARRSPGRAASSHA